MTKFIVTWWDEGNREIISQEVEAKDIFNAYDAAALPILQRPTAQLDLANIVFDSVKITIERVL